MRKRDRGKNKTFYLYQEFLFIYISKILDLIND